MRVNKIDSIILAGWESYRHKVASGLLNPDNEKMMQLHLAQIYQTLCPVYEYERSESIKVLLEVREKIRDSVVRDIDVVIEGCDPPSPLSSGQNSPTWKDR